MSAIQNWSQSYGQLILARADRAARQACRSENKFQRSAISAAAQLHVARDILRESDETNRPAYRSICSSLPPSFMIAVSLCALHHTPGGLAVSAGRCRRQSKSFYTRGRPGWLLPAAPGCSRLLSPRGARAGPPLQGLPPSHTRPPRSTADHRDAASSAIFARIHAAGNSCQPSPGHGPGLSYLATKLHRLSATTSRNLYVASARQVPRTVGEIASRPSRPSRPGTASWIQSGCGGSFPVSLRACQVPPAWVTTSPR